MNFIVRSDWLMEKFGRQGIWNYERFKRVAASSAEIADIQPTSPTEDKDGLLGNRIDDGEAVIKEDDGKKPTKLALEPSLHSLYFVSLLNLDGEEKVPQDFTELNKIGDSTLQDIYVVKYRDYTLINVVC